MNTMNVFKKIAGSTAVFFAILIAVSFFLIDYGKIHDRIVIRTLNDNMPQHFAYFLKIVEGNYDQEIDPQLLGEFANYYEIVVKYIPKLAEAHLMLGVSYYHLGRKKEALKELEKAAVLAPQFFWNQYNLGALNYDQGDYKRSSEILEGARLLRPEVVLLVMKKSVVYKRLLRSVTNFGENVMPRIRSGYSECYRLLVLSFLKQEDYANAIRYSKEAISLGLEYKELFFYYAAVASFHLGQHAVSVNLLKQALELDENFSQAYHYLSLNLTALGQEDMAQEVKAKAEILSQAGMRKHPEENEFVLKVL